RTQVPNSWNYRQSGITPWNSSGATGTRRGSTHSVSCVGSAGSMTSSVPRASLTWEFFRVPASSPRGMTDPTGLAPAAARSRVLLLTTSYPRFAGDSAGHFVQAEAQALVRSGHQVTV